LDASSLVAIVAASFTPIGAAGTGLWFIAKLSATLDRLNQMVDTLTSKVEAIDGRVDSHADRITKLEARRDK